MVKWTAEPTAAVSRIGITASGARSGAHPPVDRGRTSGDGGRTSGDGVSAATGGDMTLADREAPEMGAAPRSGSWLRRRSRSVRGRVRATALRMALIARTRAEAGMSTAEYAVGTIAACGFAALLWKILTSGEVRSMLSALVQKALKLAG
ncbi:DUF4244 domain-containing protein [Sphaerimonospora mesophila]|uniref:DUF4244 domain-containing protein n=1 Tax=Sphaerimonospora mesophila TaxID=37483 RepID=UPI0006E263D2